MASFTKMPAKKMKHNDSRVICDMGIRGKAKSIKKRLNDE